MNVVNRIWQDAGGILETALAQPDPADAEFAIVVDERNAIRMVYAPGWQLEALRTEYQAGTAFLVKRTSCSVSVEAQSGSDRCALQRTLSTNTMASLTGGIAHHMSRREPLLLSSSR